MKISNSFKLHVNNSALGFSHHIRTAANISVEMLFPTSGSKREG
jgi:hypothetical protein